MTTTTSFVKDPDDVLDYTFDFDTWMPTGDSLSSFTVTPTGVTVDSSASSGNDVTVWLSGGTAGTVATVRCRAVTTGGRTRDVTVNIQIRER